MRRNEYDCPACFDISCMCECQTCYQTRVRGQKMDPKQNNEINPGQSYVGDEHQYTQTGIIGGSPRSGSPEFYKLLKEMEDIHERKSHDYTHSNDNPFENYYFAGEVAKIFSYSPHDAGFVGRLAEKIYRIAALESSGKVPRNETIEDTEKDIATIATLWMASRRDRRNKITDQEKQLKPSEDYYTLQEIMKLTNKIHNPDYIRQLCSYTDKLYHEKNAKSD